MSEPIYELSARPASFPVIEYIVFDHGYSVKIHMKPTDTREKIVWELEQLLKIYKGNIENDSIGK
jgi:hypothetical protein